AADQAAESLAASGAPILTARVGQRAAFTDAFVRGKGVNEIARSSKASEEIKAVAAEVLATLG
ncbi:MAG: hypothetical protein AAF501_11350, partial [Pseudomonadota bacterium]